MELRFRAANIGPTTDEICREPNRDLRWDRRNRLGELQLVAKRARFTGKEQAQRVDTLRDLVLKSGELRLSSCDLGRSVRHVEVVADTAPLTIPGEVEDLTLRAEIFCSNGLPKLRAPQLYVVARYLTEERDQHVAPVLD